MSEGDLRRSQAEWETHGRIDPFPPGSHDPSDRLLIPEKLYGREREIDALLAAFDRVVAHATPELVLVSGYSGVGKSSVVHELHRPLVPLRGLFASGKFDQYKRDIPYTTLAQAFQALVRQILAKSEAEVRPWRKSLSEALGPHGQLIVNLIPEVEFVIGKQPPVPDLPPQDAQNRFQMVFRRFLGVFARPEHPLALFLDDLQWLDAATLDLIEHLVTHPEVRHLLLVGAYRDNEVDPSHPLLRKARYDPQDGRSGAADQSCATRAGRHGAAHRGYAWLRARPCRAVGATGAREDGAAIRSSPSSSFLRSPTRGCCASIMTRRAGAGKSIAFHAKGYTDNVVDLMVGKLTRLPAETRAALRQLACLGNAAEITMLSIVLGKSNEDIHSDLWEAVRLDLVKQLDGSYRFNHDRVQEAAYSLTPEALRAEAHLLIGRLLAAHTPAEKREAAVFEIVNQLNRGAALITSPDEREQLAELNLRAAQRAKATTAYASALVYLAAGRALLTEDKWEQQYRLTFSIEYHRAECELLTADLAAAEERLIMLSRRARNVIDIAAVACLQITLYTTLDRSDRSVEVCLEYLRRDDVRWSPHPLMDDVRREYDRIWQQIGHRSVEELVELPLMTNPEGLRDSRCSDRGSAPALFTDEKLLSLAVCRMVNLSLEYGNNAGSSFAYVWLGMIIGPHFGDYQAGFRFGRLGYDLVEKRGLHRYQARTYIGFGNSVMPWTRHIQAGQDMVRRAFDAANRIGDLAFAAYSCNNLNTNLLAAGDPLDDVQREAENGLDFARKARFGLVIDIITAQLALIRTLRGLTPKLGSFNDEGFNESQFEDHLRNDSRLALPQCWYWIRKLQARVYANDYASAIEAASKAEQLLWTSPSFFELAEYHFYGALAQAAQCDAAAADDRTLHLERLAAHHKQIEVWAENCPENFENRAALVAAEIARLEGRELDAQRLYEQAIRSASANNFVHHEALANELASRFYAACGFEKIARVYLQDARYGYLRWGADGKVRQLEQLHPHLRNAPIQSSSTTTIGAPVEHLDVGSALKAAQAVSSEIVLDKLIEKLMRIAVEHAGASAACLSCSRATSHGSRLKATTGRGQVEVTLRETAVSADELPESLLHYVIRTRESVLIDDALVQNAFSADQYISRKHARSILCLPMVKQSKLIGVLYLENNLASQVFTPTRISVLEFLESQAAISLENARLYSDLQEREARIHRLIESNMIGIMIGDSRGKIIDANDAFLNMLGYSRDDLVSGRVRWTKLTPAEWAPADQDAFAQMSTTGSFKPYEKEFLRKDGSRVPDPGRRRGLRKKQDEGVAFVVDMTDRKRADEKLRASEQRFLDAQMELAHITRMTTLGELTASIAHEVNQPLAGVVANAEACLRWLGREIPDLGRGVPLGGMGYRRCQSGERSYPACPGACEQDQP